MPGRSASTPAGLLVPFVSGGISPARTSSWARAFTKPSGYARGDDEPVPEEKKLEYEEENAPLTSREDRAGKQFLKAVGNMKRAAVVLTCIDRGDKPVKKVGDKSWVPAWEEIKGDRDELRTRLGEGDIFHAFQFAL